MTEQPAKVDPDSFWPILYAAQKDGGAPFLWKKLRSGELDESIFSTSDLIGRSIYHLDRMLLPGRSAAEAKFANDIITHSKDIYKGFDDDTKFYIHRVIGSEGYDTTMWWTLAPYIHLLLSEKFGEKNSLRKVLEWSLDGKSVQNSDHWDSFNLRGLEIYNSYGHSGYFILGEDPAGPSHQLALSEAQRIVDEVFMNPKQ